MARAAESLPLTGGSGVPPLRESMMGNITPEVLEGVMRTGRIPSQKATAEPSIMPNGAYNQVRFGGPETVKELTELIDEERSMENQNIKP